MCKRLTNEVFTDKANTIHNFCYDYSKSEYINNRSKVVIGCKHHGDFIKEASVHLKGYGCPTCARENNSTNTEDFIKNAKLLYRDLYDYSKVVCKGYNKKVKIICKKHGIFEQSLLNHLRSEGCKGCAKDRRTKTTETFVEEAKEIHGDRYDYSNSIYVNAKTKININCKIHGVFKQLSNTHLYGGGCEKCGIVARTEKNKSTTKEFIKKSKKTHGDLFDYSETIYTRSNDKLLIRCKTHGIFKQAPLNHLSGQGCPKCATEHNRFKRSEYIKQANERICTFYTLRCFNENENFYKIGITMNNVKKRYNSIRAMPYNYEIISEIHGEAGFIWDLEVSEKRKLKEFHYTPIIIFCGCRTECFTQYK